jgi:hypothetical protein
VSGTIHCAAPSVHLGAHASAYVLACRMLMSQYLCLVSSLAPCLVRRDRERSDTAVRVRASSSLEGSRTQGLGSNVRTDILG